MSKNKIKEVKEEKDLTSVLFESTSQKGRGSKFGIFFYLIVIYEQIWMSYPFFILLFDIFFYFIVRHALLFRCPI